MTTEEQATPVEISSSLRSPTPLDDILEELVEDLQEPPKKKAKSRVPTDAVTCLPSNVMQSWIRHPEHTIQTDWMVPEKMGQDTLSDPFDHPISTLGKGNPNL
jgi:hypothetical protein